MNCKNNLIIVSGPAASGKTTLINSLCNHYKGYIAKPADAYIQIAAYNNITKERAFSEVKREEAEEYFCNLCQLYKCVVGDQHMAIQYYKDSNMATSNVVDEKVNEEYVPAISPEFIKKLKKYGINVFMILLEAEPEVLFDRAQKRYIETEQPLRNKELKDVEAEVEAEKRFFNSLVKETNTNHCIIDVTDINEREVYETALREIEIKSKERSESEWTR